MFQLAFAYSYARDNGIDPYFQDPKWFEHHETDIRSLFGDGIGYIDKVAIHVRRGDYINNPFYVDLIKDGYYERAIKLFPNERFLVFSDDIGWCVDNFMDGKNMDFSMGKSEEEDLKLMASCKSHIIANSSFSYWAAWLGKKEGQRVCYPKNWYSDGIKRTVCPSQWIGL